MSYSPIPVSIVAKTGDKVNVLNYRKRPAAWEPGTVHSVEASIRKDLSFRVQYVVITDRITKGDKYRPEWIKRHVWLTVGEDKIQLIEQING